MLASVAALAIAAAASAADAPFSGDVVLMPASMIQPLVAQAEDGATAQPALHGINLPGRHLRGGDGWWFLACAQNCVLSAASLSIQPMTHSQYDGDPLPSQGLVFHPTPPHRDTHSTEVADLPQLLLVFKTLRGLSALPLTAGPVRTWLHAGQPEYPKPGGDPAMATLIRMDGGRTAVLRPVLNLESRAVTFELSADGRRQHIDRPYQFDMDAEHALTGPSYLRWAGDLDGDGALDLVLSFAERGIDVALYLSSLAPDGALVGEAGRFVFWNPSDPGC